MNRFFLIDCNNFFVSCERVFDPRLRNKPVVVLSSNDACIIARSQEAKALGIPMGAAFYEWKKFLQKNNVIVLSSNFTLYGDMSARVMQTVAAYADETEIYSIDEAFLHINQKKDTPEDYYTAYAHFLRSVVYRNTGIPISIGIGQTKTLAKVANKIAKKNQQYNGVFALWDAAMDDILATIPVGDIWGIGRRWSKKLLQHKIISARDLKYANDAWIKKNLNIIGLQTAYELRGHSCLPLAELQESKDSITVSRSCGTAITSLALLQEALATHVSTAAEKLRKQRSCAYHLSVFVEMQRYQEYQRFYDGCSVTLPAATNYTPELIAAAQVALKKLYQQGISYKKVGVILSDFIAENEQQLSTYHQQIISLKKQAAIMTAVDGVNTSWGRNTLFYAAAGTERSWQARCAHRTPRYTTTWTELLTVR